MAKNGKKYGKKKTASDLKMKMYNESLSKEKIYLEKYIMEKKKKGQPCHTNWKKIKRQAIGWSKEKENTIRAAKLQCKKCSILSRVK